VSVVRAQVLNLFLALLLSSFGAESFQHSQEDSEPNKLQEAADRINRVVNLLRMRAVAVWTEMQRQRRRSTPAQYNVGDSAVGPSFDAKLHPTSVIDPAAAAAAAAANTGAVNYNGPNVVVDVQPSGILGRQFSVSSHGRTVIIVIIIILVHGQVTIIFVVSVGLSVCLLFVCLFVQSFSQPSLIRFRSN